MKVVFPAVWLGTFLAGDVALFLGPSRPEGTSDPSVGFPIVTVLGAVFFWRTLARLKKIRVDDEGLWVSNFRTEEFVPYAEVRSVREWRWWSPRFTAIQLKRPFRFGTEILFVPSAPRMMGDRRDHPSTTFLRERAGLEPTG
jgi:hypothetical protein